MVETMGIEPTTPCLQSRTETFEFPLFIGHTLGKRPRSDRDRRDLDRAISR